MIEVITNGFDKEFYQECFVCQSLIWKNMRETNI